MTYVMSDLHGLYDQYLRLLHTIRYNADAGDRLYLLGDLVDRGPDGVRLVLDAAERPGVTMLLGNHDWLAHVCLKALCSGVKSSDLDPAMKSAIRDWLKDGGLPTLNQFCERTPEDKRRFLDAIREMPHLVRLEVGGKRYHLSHTVPDCTTWRNTDESKVIRFLTGQPEYGMEYLHGLTIVTGHTPTELIDPASKGRIWQGNGHLALDCGAGFGGPLGCICLETSEEFYAIKVAKQHNIPHAAE